MGSIDGPTAIARRPERRGRERTTADLQPALAALTSRLDARRGQIEEATLTRIYAISDPAEVGDPQYAEGLRAAVAVALDYGLAGIGAGEAHSPQIPAALLTQARVAARSGVSLDTVLRRYFAGYSLLDDFLIEESTHARSLGGTELKCLLRSQATLFDRLLAAIGDEFAREADMRPDTSEKHRAERVKRLLAGELLDSTELAYDFDAFHLGLAAAGPGAADALRALAASLDRRLLLVRPDRQTAWAWLGGRRRPDPEQLEARLSSDWPAEAVLALGEPAEGLAGWRLSHGQARAALSIARRGPERVVRYADVALLASALQDDLLRTSLQRLYLVPLGGERDGSEAAKDTLRAYFAAAGNVSSAAAALGVSRRTVASRLRAIEDLLGRPPAMAGADLEVALRLDALADAPPAAHGTN